MILKGLRALLKRREKGPTRGVSPELDTDISNEGDTRTLSSLSSIVGSQNEITAKSRRTGLNRLGEMFKRKGQREYVQTEIETTTRGHSRAIPGVGEGTIESMVVIEHHKTGRYRLGAILKYLFTGRLSRRLPEVDRNRDFSSSNYTTSASSSVDSIVGSSDDADVPSSEDVSIIDPEENRLLLPQEIAVSRIYRPLKIKEIRVLEILPIDEQMVHCRIKHTRLVVPRDYNALSYTWGDTSQLRTIIVNGYPLQVTENCEAALKELRREVLLTGKPQIIWIDAVCINQTDVVERTQQVRLMREIYYKSQKLIVWLGPEKDGSSGAVDIMKEMTASRESAIFEEWSEFFAKDPNHVERWVSVMRLISRPWFTRAWIFQEYVTCAKKARPHSDQTPVEFYCGKDRISPYVMGITSKSGGEFISMISQIGPKADDIRTTWAEEGEKIIRGFNSLSSLFTYSQRGVLDPIQFFSCILDNLYRFATDPRDHIYAYFGFCTQIDKAWLYTGEGNMVPGFMDLIVDYEASLEDVFASLVRVVVSATGRLDVLSICFKRNSEIKTSWVIDLQEMASVRQGNRIEKHQGLLASQFLNRFTKRRYFASKDKVETAFFLQKPPTILVKGFRFEMVYNGFDSGIWEIMASSRALVERVSQFLGKMAEKTVEEARRLLWDISIGGTSFEAKVGYYESWIEWLDTPIVSGVEENTDDICEHWDNIMKQQQSDRTIFFLKTLKGWPLTRAAKGWKTMKQDDIVCIIFGCDVPLVLRPVDDHFELIGDCYVDGIMEGQAMDLLEKGEFKEESFVIR